MSKHVILPDWLEIQNRMHNTVVQVFSQVGKFNWLEPYKIEEQMESRGTGFLINQDGYIVTSFHVVDEAKKVRMDKYLLLGAHYSR